MDKFQELLTVATCPVFVLGNPSTKDYVLVPADGDIPSPGSPEFRERGLQCWGALGLVQGLPQCALDDSLDPESVLCIASAYALCVADAQRSTNARELAEINTAMRDEWDAFSSKLWTLEDPR